MMITEQKKYWEKPQLVILLKGTPDENVLLHCKFIGNTTVVTVPNITGQQGCDADDEKGNCGACQARPKGQS